ALPAPAHDAGALGFAARRLAQELAAWLHARGLGVSRFELALVHEPWQRARIGRPATTIVVPFAAPARAIGHLSTVLAERLPRVERAWIFRDHRHGTDDGEWWLHGWFA